MDSIEAARHARTSEQRCAASVPRCVTVVAAVKRHRVIIAGTHAAISFSAAQILVADSARFVRNVGALPSLLPR